MTAMFFRDGYTDRPTTPRAVLEHELRRLKVHALGRSRRRRV